MKKAKKKTTKYEICRKTIMIYVHAKGTICFSEFEISMGIIFKKRVLKNI